MQAGFEVYNDGNALVIDGTYRNMSFRLKGTAVTTTVVDQFSTVTVSLSGLSGYPCVAVKSSSGAWAAVRSYASGACLVDIVALGGVGTSVDYYIFDLPQPIAGDNAGLQVFNAAGDMVFSSSHRYVRIVGSITASAGPSLPSNSITLAAGKTYAVMQNNPMAYAKIVNQSPVPGEQDWYLYSMRGCFKVASNVITAVASEFAAVHYGVTVPPPYSVAATGFVVDVTGY
ncbi:hypothetical protein IMW82_00845 [Rhodanobacter sp. B2A1Ga4]|uniref:hypothetical protein n=1 Tax=Rhodanobacter sp. B2A1Ga4 TaxID=2778647 RepID=UPI001B37542E|nr:hypothetical protein [Rhodanobacter sp. B2A1Ga4]MBQ4853228.1 hypothetical protein [Rhodanobacter sp. B2A1Ga4]